MTAFAPTISAPPSWQAVDLLSDLHLHEGDPKTAEVFSAYLAATPAQALFILGDLFEVWVGDDCLVPGSFEHRVAGWLQRASLRIKIHFMHGNRDFLFGALAARACGTMLLPDPSRLAFDGQRWLLTHGDALCLADAPYMAFRATVRQQEWQQAFLAQTLPERRIIARGLRAQSDARRRAGHDAGDVDEAEALNWLSAAACNTMVHGHTHRPADHALTARRMRTVLSDWDCTVSPPRAEVLRLSSGGQHRVKLV